MSLSLTGKRSPLWEPFSFPSRFLARFRLECRVSHFASACREEQRAASEELDELLSSLSLLHAQHVRIGVELGTVCRNRSGRFVYAYMPRLFPDAPQFYTSPVNRYRDLRTGRFVSPKEG